MFGVLRSFLPLLFFSISLLLLLLTFLWLNAISFLKFTKTKGIGHQCLVGSLFLLLHHKQRILANFRGDISDSVGILDGDETLVRSSQLDNTSGLKNVRIREETYLCVVIRGQDFVHSLLSKEVVLQVVRVLVAACRWRSIHPF